MLESLQEILPIVIPVFFLIGLGYLYNTISRADLDSLVGVTMRVLIPAFAFYHIYQMKIDLQLANAVFLSAWIVILGAGMFTYFLFRFLPGDPGGLYLPVMFMNSVNLPFPIILSAYGEEALPFGIMFYLASILGVFTVGLGLVSGKNSILKIFQEPVIYMIGLSFFFKLGPVPVPTWFLSPLELLSHATIPMVLLILGMQLSQVKPSQWSLSLLAACCRFVFGALLGYFCIWLFHLEGLPAKVVFLESIMPSAVITYLVAKKYDADPSLVASTVFLSTLMSLVLIPIALVAVDYLF